MRWPIFPSKKERFCCSAAAESGPTSEARSRPAALRSTAIGSTADSPLAEPTRASARSAAPRPSASGAGRSERWRALAASQSSGRRPSGSRTLTSQDIPKSVARRKPSKPFEWTCQRSEAVSPKPAVQERMASDPGADRAAASIAWAVRSRAVISSAPCPGSKRSRSSSACPRYSSGSGRLRNGSGASLRVSTAASETNRSSASGLRSFVESEAYRPSTYRSTPRPRVVASVTFSSLPSRNATSTWRARQAAAAASCAPFPRASSTARRATSSMSAFMARARPPSSRPPAPSGGPARPARSGRPCRRSSRPRRWRGRPRPCPRAPAPSGRCR